MYYYRIYDMLQPLQIGKTMTIPWKLLLRWACCSTYWGCRYDGSLLWKLYSPRYYIRIVDSANIYFWKVLLQCWSMSRTAFGPRHSGAREQRDDFP